MAGFQRKRLGEMLVEEHVVTQETTDSSFLFIWTQQEVLDIINKVI